MILGVDPINLGPIRRALRGLVELEDIPDATTELFDEPRSRAVIDAAVKAFTRSVDDNSHREPDIRRGLAYLLNLDDEALATQTAEYWMYLPARVDVRRRFLRMLWDATFAPPEIYNYYPEDVELVDDGEP
jgi:hypothetical protein